MDDVKVRKKRQAFENKKHMYNCYNSKSIRIKETNKINTLKNKPSMNTQ